METFIPLFYGAGLGFSFGLAGLLDPKVCMKFFASPLMILNGDLDFFNINPSLLVILASAIIICNIIFTVAFKSFKRPFFVPRFSFPPKATKFRLIVGSILFGIGWALGGFFPGPAPAAIVSGHYSAVLFSLFMIGGMSLWLKRQNNNNESQAPILIFFTIIGIFYYFWRGGESIPIHKTTITPSTSPFEQHLISGITIGLLCGFMMLLYGEVLGVCIIMSRLFTPFVSRYLKTSSLSFTVGLIVGGEILFNFYPSAFSVSVRPAWCFAVGGFLVGFGGAMSHSCITGQLISGNGKYSLDSFISIFTIFLLNFIFTTFVLSFGLI